MKDCPKNIQILVIAFRKNKNITRILFYFILFPFGKNLHNKNTNPN